MKKVTEKYENKLKEDLLDPVEAAEYLNAALEDGSQEVFLMALKDVAEASLVKKKDIARCYRLLLRELDIKMPTADPIRSVPKIASKLGLNEKTQQTSIELLHRAEQKKAIAGKDPMGLAAAAIYIACVIESERKTQKEIAEAAGVTEVTVRNRYKGLRRTLKLEV